MYLLYCFFNCVSIPIGSHFNKNKNSTINKINSNNNDIDNNNNNNNKEFSLYNLLNTLDMIQYYSLFMEHKFVDNDKFWLSKISDLQLKTLNLNTMNGILFTPLRLETTQQHFINISISSIYYSLLFIPLLIRYYFHSL